MTGTPLDSVGQLSARRASLTPERTALVDRTTGREFTYAEVDARANRAARLLGERGVEKGDRVATLSRNRPAMVDLFFATAKLGAVLAPLSHRLAPPTAAELLDTVEPELLVAETPFDGLAADVLAAADADPDAVSLATAEDDGSWESYAAALPEDDAAVDGPGVALSDPHLFLHTGGSTGTPKEVVIPHRSVVWNSLNTITAWGLRAADTTPMVFPTFHTGGWNVITVPLFHVGGTVVIEREFDPAGVLDCIEDRSATVLVAVPAMLRMLTEADAWDDADLSSLRFAKSGGGPAREAVLSAWWDRGVDLSQGYGLTECGPNNFAMPEDWPREKADSVGVPAPHVDAHVVAEDGTPVEQGAVGELELRGPHAADRYWGDPEETAATFGDPGDGEGWVSTGDLARVDEDGYVYIEGRKKNMYVSGGENVYPPEVEDAVADHPAVAEVVVVPVDDDTWGQVGRAVVELADGATEDDLSVDELRSFLDDRLAGFKHPRDLAFVDEVPTSGPSKVDRQAVADAFGDGR
jgi:fatty-acyl-CoA synthase